MRFSHLAIALAVIGGLAGCSRDTQPNLLNIRSGTPDEFAIKPSKPLEMPDDLASLPQPTPGGGNLTDVNPAADAVAALGGRPGAVTRSGQLPASDAALISHATRFGLAGNIRPILAEEDLQFRRDNNGRLLERLANKNVYFRAYRGQSLDQHAELARWRRAGARNVTAPPEGLVE